MARRKAKQSIVIAPQHLPAMSANMVALHTDRPKEWRRYMVIVTAVFVLLTVLVVSISVTKGPTPIALTGQTVSQGKVKYEMSFYPHASVQQKNGIVYSTALNPAGQELQLWVIPLESALSCGKYPPFPYTSKYVLRASCSQPDRKLYVANIEDNHKTYQINLSSKQPIGQEEASDIFSSITLR